LAAVGDASEFDNGRHLAAWLGLVPRQHSSGGKSRLGGISKRGNTYLRTLLIHGGNEHPQRRFAKHYQVMTKSVRPAPREPASVAG
jgi:transposase